MRIGLLEDDADQAVQIVRMLQNAGHGCQVYSTGARLLQGIVRETFDMLLLDWMLPDTTGLAVLKTLRQREDATPVIFVTSRDAEEDIVEALRNGADDYLAKPVRGAELLARLEALKRRTDNMVGSRLLSVPPFEFDQTAGIARVHGEIVELTQRQFQLALVLFRNTGRLLSRQHLMESVWGLNDQVQTRTLDIHVSQLRNALRLPENGWRISAVYAHGYRLEPRK